MQSVKRLEFGSPVHDVAWAPNLGRSFHQIASASQDKVIRVWRVNVEGGTCTAGEPVILEGHHAPVCLPLWWRPPFLRVLLCVPGIVTG